MYAELRVSEIGKPLAPAVRVQPLPASRGYDISAQKVKIIYLTAPDNLNAAADRDNYSESDAGETILRSRPF